MNARHRALMQGDYPLAIRVYEALMARYPFAAETRQSRLDVIYAYYRAGESESAIDAADTFISENPTHPRIDYAWYLKGLTDFERMPNFMERWFRVDLNKRPPTQARRSFLAFATVVEQFPNSEYAHDARRRMVYLRNRLADYEIAVANYYVGTRRLRRRRAARQGGHRGIRRFARRARSARNHGVLLRPDGAQGARRADPRHVSQELRRRNGRGAQGAGEEEVVQTLAGELMGTLPIS